MIFRNYPGHVFIGFDFLDKRRIYVTLAFGGLFYNLGIWIDKIMFWYNPDTGERIVGLLNHSVIYDLPVFLAYLCIMPGMAVFLVRIEIDFVDFYQKFYDSVRDGGSLDYLNEIRDEMVYAVRQGIFEIIKIQGITVLIVFIAGPSLLRWAGISESHLPLLYVQVVGASLQVVFLGLLNVFFYLDKRMIVMILTAIFVVLNIALTALSFFARPGFLWLRLRGVAPHRRARRDAVARVQAREAGVRNFHASIGLPSASLLKLSCYETEGNPWCPSVTSFPSVVASATRCSRSSRAGHVRINRWSEAGYGIPARIVIAGRIRCGAYRVPA
jgi:hypothetical protein